MEIPIPIPTTPQQQLRQNYIVKHFADYTIMVPSIANVFTNVATPMSAVFSAHTRHLLSIASPAPLSFTLFQAKFPDMKEWTMFEMVKGTLIQLFYDDFLNKWEIATKRDVGGYACELCVPGSFRQRFIDSLNGLNGLNVEAAKSANEAKGNTIELNDVAMLASLDRALSYQFKLTAGGEAVLIAVFSIHKPAAQGGGDRGGGTATCMPLANTLPFLGHLLTFPRFVHGTKTSDLFHFYGSLASDPRVPGLVIQSKTGETTFIENVAHTNMQECRSLPTMMLYEYLCFRRAGQSGAWIQMESEDYSDYGYQEEDVERAKRIARVAEKQIGLLAETLVCAYENRTLIPKWLLSFVTFFTLSEAKTIREAATAYVASLEPMILLNSLVRKDA